MKIDENLSNKEYRQVSTNFGGHPLYPNGKLDEVLFSRQFSPKGRARDFHALRFYAYGVCVIKDLQSR